MATSKALYFDCFSGIAGDMAIAACLDAGVPISYLRRELKKLKLDGYSISAKQVKHSAIVATQFFVKIKTKQKSRDYATIKKMITSSKLSSSVKKMAGDIFLKIAEAEAAVHGSTLEKVHFHEVGAVDSIVDVVGTAICLEKLAVRRFFCSPIPTGHGLVNTQHGKMPLPAPATLLILKGVPMVDGGAEMELTTPTGAAIVAALCEGFGSMPMMKPETASYGAGSFVRQDGVPNLLRLMIANVAEQMPVTKQLRVIETNMDDVTGEEAGFIFKRMFSEAALDVWVTAIGMKKSRPAMLLSVLCKAEDEKRLTNILLEETPTLGVRAYSVERTELPRKIVKIKTEFGVVRVKVAVAPSGKLKIKPEYEDVAKMAKKHRLGFMELYNTLLAIAKKELLPAAV